MMVTIASFMSLAVFSGVLLSSFVRSVINVRDYELKRYEDFKKKGAWTKIKESVFQSVILGVCSLIAANYAELRLVWFLAGLVFFALAGVLFFATIVKYLKNIPTEEVPELTEEVLERNIAKRRRYWIYQIALLLLWIYSWKGLIA